MDFDSNTFTSQVTSHVSLDCGRCLVSLHESEHIFILEPSAEPPLNEEDLFKELEVLLLCQEATSQLLNFVSCDVLLLHEHGLLVEIVKLIAITFEQLLGAEND